MKLTKREQAQQLKNIGLEAGALVLENGGEIYRVEETTRRIISTCEGITNVNVFSAYNVIMVSFEFDQETYYALKRTFVKKFDLLMLHRINVFSRNFVREMYSISESLDIIDEMKQYEPKFFHRMVAMGIGSASISYFIMEDISGSIVSFFISMLALLVHNFLARKQQIFFVNLFLTCLFSTLLSGIVVYFMEQFGLSVNMDAVIVGNIMAYVPGVAITNSIRDVMGGDMVSGVSAAINAVFVATAIALGVGSVLMVMRGIL